MKRIGERIRQLREGRGLTQLELSKDLNVAQQTVAQWENEERDLKTGSIIALANYFNVTADYILGLASVPNRNYGELVNDHLKLIEKVKKFKELFESVEEYVNNDL